MEQEKGKIVPLQREATGEDTLIRTRVRSTKTKHHGADEFRRLIREAEKKTKAGILAMMEASRPGMYEYQYKAEFDRALAQFGPEG